MAGELMGDPSHHGLVEKSPYKYSHDRVEDADRTGSSWYLSRREIEENSPSRKDGIDLKKETHIRKSYCTFLQELGQRLKVPQVTIATAIVFCHRFFLRQSLAKNDRRTIATVCMFLAGKVEETPRPLKDVILVAYEIIHKKSSEAVQKRIKQKEVYEQEKEVILLAERVVLATLGCDFNVNHPYKPLVAAIKKFKAIDSDKDLPRVAWNFVNDGLRTSLCLQFESHHIAAGAIFLAAKFLKVKLPSDGDKSWWQEFDVTPRQLEEVSNQMLEMYEQYPAVPPPHGNETRGRPAAGARQNAPAKAPRVAEEPSLGNGHASSPNTTGVQHGIQTNSTCSAPDQSFLDKLSATQRTVRNEDNGYDHGNKEPGVLPEGVLKNHQHQALGNVPEASSSKLNHVTGPAVEELGLCGLGGTTSISGAVQCDVKGPSATIDTMKNIDKDDLKAAQVKQRESQAEGATKEGILDGDDTIKRDPENGFELTAGDEKMTKERRQPLRDESQYMDLRMEDRISRTETENTGEGELLLDSRV